MNKREIAESLVEEYLTSQGKKDFIVLEVWHCYLLGNDKWIFTSTASHSPYFEVTRNNNKGEYYLDVYVKELNQVWKECIVNKTEEHDFRRYMGTEK